MSIPRHIAIIPDGNRRWAKRHGLASWLGHREGAERAEKILEAALETGVTYYTFWGCSVSNVAKRDALEVRFLFELFEQFFKKLLTSEVVQKHEVRVRMLGEWRAYFPAAGQKVIEQLMRETEHFSKNNLTFLLAYNGTSEMTAAVSEIVELGRSRPELVVTEEVIKDHLWTRDLPPVDLVIRTGGEPHWSTGFMMWDVAEARLYFTDTLWPDFSEVEFQKALDYYEQMERREGK